MNLEAEKKFSCGKVTLISPDEHQDSLKKSYLEATEEDERGASYSRRRSVHFVSDPTTVIVPGSEEKEHRGRGEGPAVRVKEIHPGGINEDLSEDSDGEADQEEKLRLRQAKETARRQSEPAFPSNVQRKSSRVRSPPPPCNPDDDEDEDEDDEDRDDPEFSGKMEIQ